MYRPFARRVSHVRTPALSRAVAVGRVTANLEPPEVTVSEPEPEAPDMQTNQLKLLMRDAASRAEQTGTTLAPGGGNPLRGALSALADAWVSPARERTVYAENLEGAGSAVVAAFDAQADHAAALAGAEPAKVDADDPHEGWKASTTRIASRASAPYFEGY